MRGEFKEKGQLKDDKNNSSSWSEQWQVFLSVRKGDSYRRMKKQAGRMEE